MTLPLFVYRYLIFFTLQSLVSCSLTRFVRCLVLVIVLPLPPFVEVESKSCFAVLKRDHVRIH